MKPFALLLTVAFAAVGMGGCTGIVSEDDKPQTHYFEMVVNQGLSDTVALYQKNDGNYSRAIAIPFKLDAADPAVVPGPEIRVKEGDTVVIHLVNPNGLSHTLHLHGGLVPWEMDGMDYLTQDPVMSGKEYNYTFPNLKAGTYWYHCHMDGAHHIDLGMYGAFIVEERHPAVHYDREYVVLLDEYDNCHVHGNLDPVDPRSGSGQEPTPDTQKSSECFYRFLLDNLAQNQQLNSAEATTGSQVPQAVKDQFCPQVAALPEGTAQEKAAKANAEAAFGCTAAHAHGNPPPQQTPRVWWPETSPVYNPAYNTFLVNGKAFPDTPVFPVKQGETVLFRLINVGNQWHAWHVHGHTMHVVARDSYPLASPFDVDTLSIGPGERYDYTVKMDNPGLWMLHDQNGLTNTNDNVAPGGMMACMPYDGFHNLVDAFAMKRSLDCNTVAREIYGGHHHG
jgi:plastocyanin